MKFGLTLPYGPPAHPGAAEPDFALPVVQRAEQLGFDSIWAGEHVIVAADYAPLYPYAEDGIAKQPLDAAYPDPLVWLSWIGAHTSTIKLASSVIVLTQRQPVLLAKQASTVDRLSGGRLILGVGIGWQKEESEALGFPYRARGQRCEEFIAAMRELWAGPESSYKGEWVEFDRVYSYPKPVQPSGPPIIIGGHSKAAAERAGRLAQGLFALVADPAGAADMRAHMDDAARAAGRDPATLELTVGRPPDDDSVQPSEVVDEVKAYRDAGAQRLVLFRNFDKDPDALITELESFARNVMDKL